MLEMQSLLRAALRRFALLPAGGSPEKAARRGITITPARQARVVLGRRSSSGAKAEGAVGEPAVMPAAVPA
jgi:hypothetical protein